MANIQEDVTREVWQLFLKFFGTGSEFVYNITHEGNVMLKQGTDFVTEFFTALINKKKELGEPTDFLARMLDRNRKGEGILTMPVADEEANALCKLLDKKELLYNVVEDTNDDRKILMFMANDAEQVKDTINLFLAQKKRLSELTPELFLENYATEGIGTLSGLNKVDLDIFRDNAKRNNLVFASVKEAEDKYIVIYEPKDKDLVKKTMASTVWTFSGKEGHNLRKQMDAYLGNMQSINNTLLHPEKEYYIVSSKNPEIYVHLTANDLTYYKNSNIVLNEKRSSKEFIEKGKRVFNGITAPVLLTRAEFEKLKENGELDKEAIRKIVAEKAKTLPEIDKIKDSQQKQNDRLEKIQSKMALDDENTAGFWIYDDGIDFADSGRYENLEDIDEETKKDLEEACKKASDYEFIEIASENNRNIDYLIAEAKKRRSQTTPKSQDRDREEQSQDL